MDGHFVPNISFGTPIMQSIRGVTRKPFDVHLMIAPVDPYLESFARPGPTSSPSMPKPALISIVPCRRSGHGQESRRLAQSGDARFGSQALYWIGSTSSCHVGQSGLRRSGLYPGDARQDRGTSRDDTRPKHRHRGRRRHRVWKNAGEIVRAGDNALVAGSSIFKTQDYAAAIKSIRTAATGVAI